MQRNISENLSAPVGKRYTVIGWLLSFVSGAVASCGTLFGIHSPVVASLTGVLPVTDGIFVFLGAMISYMISGTLSYSIIDVTAMLVIMTVKVVVCGIMSKEVRAVGNTFITGACYLLSASGISLLTPITPTVVAVVIARTVICTATAYILYSAGEKILHDRKIDLTRENVFLFSAAAAVVFASLVPMSFVFLSLGRILAVLSCIIIARKYGASAGAVCGAAMSFSMLIFSADGGKAALFFAVAGAIAGLVADKGIVSVSLVFLGVGTACVLVSGADSESARTLADTIAAVACAILIPERIWGRLFGTSFVAGGGSCVESAASRLEFAARSIREMRKDIVKIADGIEKRREGESLANTVCDRVCAQCRNNLVCWERDFDKTSNAFGKMESMVTVRGVISESTLPEEMSSCYRKYALVGEFNSMAAEMRAIENAQRRMREMRGILCEQFCSMEDMLMNISSDIAGANFCDERLTKRVKKYLEKKGAQSVRVCVSLDDNGRMNVQGYYSGGAEIVGEELSDELFDITDRDFSVPAYSTADTLTAFAVSEKAKYSAEFGVAQCSAVRGEISGDTAKCFCDGAGNASVILSDGMGQGRRAAVDSRMTAVMLTRLLSAGVGLSAAVRLINSSMQVKSADESFATLDITNINLFSGDVEMIKFGAAATFLFSDGKVEHYETNALPLGILSVTEMDSRSCRIKDGDIIAVVSDGISDDCYDEVGKALAEGKDLSAQEISEWIMASVNGNSRDDISVAVVKISKNKEKILA